MTGAFKVLSVDGGGIRGLMPALILAEIEERTKRPISDMFDLLAGTSTGGIIALGLTKPDGDGRPEQSAQDIVRLYAEDGHTIFPSSFLQGVHLSAIRGAKYNSTGIDRILRQRFGEVRLKEALKPVLVASYDIEKQVPIFFKSERAKASADSDFLMRDVARATSAAPTYFPPLKVPASDPLDYYALIDGGVVAGNPAMCAYAEAIKMGLVEGGNLLMVSLGTGEQQHPLKFDDAVNWGQLEWAQPIINIVLQGSNATVDYQLQQLLRCEGDEQDYYRFQPELTYGTGEMDDARDTNLKHLIDLTQDFLGNQNTRDALSRLCDRLTA